jgi:membrane fusion protein, multidrug efflux system
VQELQGAKTVFVVGEGEKVAARTVTLGDAIDDVYIATAGLKPGERVIVEGIQKIRPGMQVTAQPVGTAPAGGGPGATPSAAPASRPNTGS